MPAENHETTKDARRKTERSRDRTDDLSLSKKAAHPMSKASALPLGHASLLASGPAGASDRLGQQPGEPAGAGMGSGIKFLQWGTRE
ncbi:hypothetical protein PGT21_023630 [Puccinia graminis f. sp. tritici]|uniref:Uncharacterized protein n=1 Tax=Puccinia graminis f. sp. tritici TaxID=56615 RepID=A0A5B0M0D7_PUCGR|nr:hypothetical protein PGT21_023630 [Puccinia graminis f. sp. tritici]KAA1075446.1 hypothetical protein PGTUg99_007578 [Puccinia graminis f. sp. tritici]